MKEKKLIMTKPITTSEKLFQHQEYYKTFAATWERDKSQNTYCLVVKKCLLQYPNHILQITNSDMPNPQFQHLKSLVVT